MTRGVWAQGVQNEKKMGGRHYFDERLLGISDRSTKKIDVTNATCEGRTRAIHTSATRSEQKRFSNGESLKQRYIQPENIHAVKENSNAAESKLRKWNEWKMLIWSKFTYDDQQRLYSTQSACSASKTWSSLSLWKTEWISMEGLKKV